MATDIAFAMGVLALLGKRVPLGLKVFLMALAIVDDMGAVLIIALFYAADVSWIILFCGIAILSVLVFLNHTGVANARPYLIIGIVLWFAFLKSGIHPTVAGVLLAMVVPSSTGARLEHGLHPWVTFGIMPLFAFANAGVSLAGGDPTHPVSLGTILGLILGKQIGITLFAWLAVRFGIAALPKSARWTQIYAIGWLGGIGFTMSLFIATLAFGASSLNDVAKIGILIASALSGITGALILLGSLRLRNCDSLRE
jgi:NhaA family Na+:H+ antiporter